ncbi:hypothetical protein F0562_005568 [Nyssa sinensis]|uniref:Uncharacterized protein n=1 Tax=Nyssa sinensis TaxID=561372 RepID=A0A5J5AKP7_9ASTE|nr:hypothetical protein F0562_005568 [Nyssa sinensis]
MVKFKLSIADTTTSKVEKRHAFEVKVAKVELVKTRKSCVKPWVDIEDKNNAGTKIEAGNKLGVVADHAGDPYVL